MACVLLVAGVGPLSNHNFSVFKVALARLNKSEGNTHTHSNAVGRSVQLPYPIRVYSRLNTIIRHMTAENRRGQRVLLRNEDNCRVVSTGLQERSFIHYRLVCCEQDIDLASVSIFSVYLYLIVLLWFYLRQHRHERYMDSVCI